MNPELHQQLFELAYGLLPDEEAAELRARLAADPLLAESWRQVERQRELLSRAARLEQPAIDLQRPKEPPDHARPMPKVSHLKDVPVRTAHRRMVTCSRPLAWSLALAAVFKTTAR